MVAFVYSKYSSTSLKEHQDPTSKQARLRLYGITTMQVIYFIRICFFFLTSTKNNYWRQLLDLYLFVDAEFGRAQAKDMLQHLWAGPTSNASVDVVQGRYSVEVHSVGVTKVTNTIVFICFYIINYQNILIILWSITCCLFSVILGKCNGAYPRRNSTTE